MKTVWVTRTEPGASETAERIRALGADPVIAPLLIVKGLKVAPPNEGEAIAFTSRNGVLHYSGATDRVAWCVGDATATAALKAGFTDVRVGDATVESLAKLMISECRTPIAHWSGEHLSGDLVGSLKGAGLTASRVVAYRAEQVEKSPISQPVDIVLLHSPRAADLYGRFAPGLANTALCLSQNVANRLSSDWAARIRVPETVTEQSLMQALGAELSSPEG